MIRMIEELYSDGEIKIYNFNKDKIASEVDKAAREAKKYVNSGDALPTWHWNIGEDDSNYYAIVLGFAEGYEPNEDEFCDSDGNHIEMKWAYIPKNSAMNEYDMDYMFPYSGDGDVWGTTIPVTGYGMQADVYYLLDDFKDYVDRVNSEYADEYDEYDESVRRNKKKSIKESNGDMMYKYSKDLLSGLRTLADDNFDTLADYIESSDANLGKFYDLLVNTADAFDKLLKFIKD